MGKELRENTPAARGSEEAEFTQFNFLTKTLHSSDALLSNSSESIDRPFTLQWSLYRPAGIAAPEKVMSAQQVGEREGEAD